MADFTNPPVTAAGLAGRIVLVVDDDPMVLMGLQMILESWGVVVLSAGTLSEAMARIADPAPELVLSDLRLTDGSSGFDVITQVRASLGRDVPAIILTGEVSAAAREQGRACGASFLEKPVQAATLRTALTATLAA